MCRYAAKNVLPDIYANIISVAPIILEVPVARPSMPSTKLKTLIKKVQVIVAQVCKAHYVEHAWTAHICQVSQLYSKRNDQDIVLFCGSPGAGKSTFYWTHLQPLKYERINQDILKTVSSPTTAYYCKYFNLSDLFISETSVSKWQTSFCQRASL